MSKHHETLGVSPSATPEEIKRAYRKLVKSHHPDVGGDEEKFKQINAAYAALTDPQAAQGENPFNSYGKDSGGNWRQYTYNTHNDFGGIDDEFIKEILRRHAGAGFRDPAWQAYQGYQAQPKNRTLSATVRVPLTSIIEEQTRVLNVNSGRNQRAVEVKIPAGVHSGAQIRYPGFGADNLTQAPPGDLIVTIIVEESTEWLRNDDDILAVLRIDALDAIVGQDVTVTGIRGNNISVSVPAGIQNNQMLRINGQGLPGADGKVGNMLLQVQIIVPRNLTAEQLQTLKAFRDARNTSNAAV